MDKCAFVSQPTANIILEKERESQKRLQSARVFSNTEAGRKLEGIIRYKNSCGVPRMRHGGSIYDVHIISGIF